MIELQKTQKAFFWGWTFFWSHYLVLSPATIFFKNLDFALSKNIFLGCVFVIGSLIVVSGLLLSKLPVTSKGWQKGLALVLLALGLFAWLETTANPIYYGPLNGHFIHWDKWVHVSVIEAAIAVFLLLMIVWARRWLLETGLKTISKVLIVSQIMVLGNEMIHYPSDQKMSWKNQKISTDSKYTFSNDRNLIVIVVDTFQSNVFEKIINDDPAYKDMFQDFTYYPDTLGGFRETAPSIPYLLTGEQYNNMGALFEFSRKSISKPEGLISILRNDQFEIEFYPLLKNLIPLGDAANAMPLGLGDWVKNLKAIGYLALIKASPQILKEYFYSRYFVSMDDRKFAEEMQTRFQITHQKKFKYYHLWGTHNPNYLNENLETVQPIYSEASYEAQAKAELKILKKFLDKLRSEQVYNNSVIAIVADHGSGNVGLIGQASESNYKLSNYTPDYVIGVSNPLLLVKKRNDNGPLKVSQTSVSFRDISQSLAYEVTENNLSASIFRSSREERIAERHFYLYDLNLSNGRTLENTSTLGQFANLKRFSVKGPLRDRASWNFDGYFNEGNITPLSYSYKSPDSIGFGNQYANDHWLGGGWSLIEDEGVWSEANWAQLKVPNLGIHRYVVELTIKDTNQRQMAEIYDQENRLVARKFINQPGNYTFIVYGQSQHSHTINLFLHFPYAQVPTQTGDVDSRRRGIFLSEVKAYPLPEVPNNYVVSLANTSPGSVYLNNSWAMPEAEGTWTAGEWNTLILPYSESMKGAILELQVASTMQKQFVEFYCGTESIGQVHVKNSKPIRMKINPLCIHDGFYEISLRIPLRGKAQALEKDYRELGIYFSNFRITSPLELPIAESMAFYSDGQAHDFLGTGWSFREEKGIWGVGQRSALLFTNTDFALPRVLELEVESPQGITQELIVSVNNYRAQVETFRGRHKLMIPLNQFVADGGFYRVTFESKYQLPDEESRALAFFLTKIELKTAPIYQSGKLLSLNNQTDQSMTLTKGWHPSEVAGTWNAASNFSLELHLFERPKTDMLLTYDIESFAKWTHYSVKANGVDIGLHGVLRSQLKQMVIFKELFRDKKLHLEFKIESGPLVTASKDNRALFFRSLVLSALPAVAVGSEYSLAASEVGFHYFVGGWSYVEPAGTWTDGNYSTLRIGRVNNAKGKAHLQFEVESAQPDNVVSFYVNEQRQKTVSVTGSQRVEVPLPGDLGDRPVDLVIKSTKSFYDRDQGRSLGILFKKMAIHESNEEVGLE